MTNLTGQTPLATYQDLLTTTNGGQGLPPDVLVPVQDGAGNDSPLCMSQNAVQLTKMMVLPCWTTGTPPSPKSPNGNSGTQYREGSAGVLEWKCVEKLPDRRISQCPL